MDISSMLEVQVSEVKEADSKENVTPRDLAPSTANNAPSVSQEETNFYKLTFGNDLASVRHRRLHCTACDVHIGSAPADAYNMFEHPVLRTLLCAKCHEFYGDGSFEQGDDATDMFCRWCANGGNLYCCSYCSNTFCYKCIKRNFDPIVRKKIEADEKWKCFVCNPSDLYTARATCWALLQHIQTVTRILQNDKRMSPQEIEEKMNLDESQCCPRRRKRKRRRMGSNSEEEDETYKPKNNGIQLVLRRKSPKKYYTYKKPKLANGIVNHYTNVLPIPIRPRPASELTMKRSTIPTSSFQRDFVPKSESTSVHSDNVGGSHTPKSSDSLPSVYNSSNVVQSPLYNANIAVASSSYLQANTSTIQQLLLQPPQKKLYQSPHCSSTPMVTIPNNSSTLLHPPRVVLRTPMCSANTTVTPNIIEIDSDSDEPTVLETPNNSITNKDLDVDISSKIVVPVALVSTEPNLGEDHIERIDQPLRERCSNIKNHTKVFKQVMQPHIREVHMILNNLKLKFHKIFEDPAQDGYKEIDTKEAYKVMKQFHKHIRCSITELANINDRVVREFNKWKRSKIPTLSTFHLSVCSTESLTRGIELPLDMTCVNDSSTEDDIESPEYKAIYPSNLSNTVTRNDLIFLRRAEISERGVGDNSVSIANKSIQVKRGKRKAKTKDYEKCIGYSLVNKNDRKPEIENDIAEVDIASVQKCNDFADTYQEQFIFYLQDIENQAIQMNSKDSPDSIDDLSFNTDISYEKQSKEKIGEKSEDKSNEGNDEKNEEDSVPNGNVIINEKNNSEIDVSDSVITVTRQEIVENPAEVVSTVSDNVVIERVPSNKENAKPEVEETDSTINNNIKSETIETALIIERDSNEIGSHVSYVNICTINEEECTIIDE